MPSNLTLVIKASRVVEQPLASKLTAALSIVLQIRLLFSGSLKVSKRVSNRCI